MSHSEEVKLYFDTLKKDLPLYKEIILEVSSDIRKEGFSQYPIFVATQLPIEVGELIINRDDLGTSWSINASTLEEFTEKGLIKSESKDAFIKIYKNPEKHCCLFLITPLGANFLFIPYSKPGAKSDFDFRIDR
jgi:hypothetical protein